MDLNARTDRADGLPLQWEFPSIEVRSIRPLVQPGRGILASPGCNPQDESRSGEASLVRDQEGSV